MTGNIITAAAFIVLAVYHARLIWMIRHHPLKTALGQADHLRGLWVESIMSERRDILAVQTLRNFTMASSFLASTAILIALGVIRVMISPEQIATVTHALNIMGGNSERLQLIKLMIVSLDFLFVFFQFALAVRYYNHVGFIINTPPKLDCCGSPLYVAGILRRGALHYTLGTRGYFFAVPFCLWLFGPIWLLAGAVVITMALWGIDRHV